MIIQRGFAILLLTVCSLGFVEPQYNGLLDLRYQKSSNTYTGWGNLVLQDFELQANFPLDPHHRLFYETHLGSTGIEIARQFFYDLDPLLVPGSLRLGRFEVPFSLGTLPAAERPFLEKDVIYDARWDTGTLVVPGAETGIGYYYHTRPFAIDAYLVNGKGSWSHSSPTDNSLVLGADIRFLVRDLIDAGFSLCFADLTEPTSASGNTTYMLAGTDYRLPVGPVDLMASLQMLSGKHKGKDVNGNGFSAETIWHLDHSHEIGAVYSLFNLTGSAQSSRLAVMTRVRLEPGLVVRLEWMSDNLQGVQDNSLQLQCQVML